ncbi:hypothetical protein ES705_22959 [subsurface metagenome]
MDIINIDGVKITPLKKIYQPKGDIFNCMKKNDLGFKSFGEAYFSTVKYNAVKAWKKHTKMTLNLIVPIGEIQFVIYDDRENSKTKGSFYEIKLSINNYNRLTISPNLWFGFKGLGKDLNLLLNLADIEHDHKEVVRLEPDKINYDWGKV